MTLANNDEHLDPFDMLDLTPDTLNTMSDAELDELRETVHEIWRNQGSKDNDNLAISASIVINNQYMLRGRKLPNEDKLDKISETKQKTAITGQEGTNSWDGEICTRCKHEQRIAWSIKNNKWNAVISESNFNRNRVFCLECFLALADKKNIGIKANDFLHFAWVGMNIKGDCLIDINKKGGED